MAKIILDQEKCKGCFLCLGVCPKQCLKKSKHLNKTGMPCVEFVANAGCVGCCACALICPDCCIEVFK